MTLSYYIEPHSCLGLVLALVKTDFYKLKVNRYASSQR
jgi:hypothetical protein